MRPIILNNSIAVPVQMIPVDKDGLIQQYVTKDGVKYGFVLIEDYWGFQVSPTLAYCGTLTPYELQKHSVQFMIEQPRCYNFCSQGCGKTMTSIWAADYLMKQQIIKKTLIVTTISNMQSTWADQFFMDAPHRTYTILKGTKDRKIKELQNNYDFYIINHDGLTTLAPSILPAYFDLLIYDEVTAIKNTNTQRFKILNKHLLLKNPHMRIIAMTGTPGAQSPLDCYGLIKLIYPGFQFSMTQFKEMTMYRKSMYEWEARPNWQDIVFDFMRPAIRFGLQDIIDLPPLTIIPHKVELTKSQLHIYNSLKKQLIAELEANDGAKTNVTVSNAAILMSKLLQVLGGVVYDADGKTCELDFEPRYQALLDIVENHDSPVVIFTSFKNIQALLYKKMTAYFGVNSIGLINGDITGDQRADEIRKFQNGEYKAILAHPKTTAHGVTLTRSNTIIWYGVCHSSELYQQGNARILRADSVGRGHTKFLIYQFYANDLELGIFKKLEQKEFDMHTLLTMIRGE